MSISPDNALRIRAAVLSLSFLVVILTVWQLATSRSKVDDVTSKVSELQRSELIASGLLAPDLDHYLSFGLTFPQLQQIAALGLTRTELETAGGLPALGITPAGAPGKKAGGFPTPGEVGIRLWEAVKDPFYDRGTNDKGIGINLALSLRRVAIGFIAAIIVALPVGFILGMSPLLNAALTPYIQILKPISPLAWMPLALYTIKDAEKSSLFVIFICSVWPMLINTAFGVAAVRKDWINIGRTLELSRFELATRIILPAAAPTIFTGMRIAIGIAWLVIVAAEMLIGGIGMGYLVWNEWNGLRLDKMLVAVFAIGLVGLLLDLGIARLLALVRYQE